jgi:nonsense-mediated mRNA decay protein 3
MKRKGKFCFKCGKKSEKLFDGYCEECYVKMNRLAKVPEKVEIEKCSKCDLVKIEGKLQEFDIIDFIKNKIESKGKIKKITLEPIKTGYNVIIDGRLKGTKKLKREEHKVRIKFKKFVCDSCGRFYAGYYEAIIQLRGDFPKSVLRFIDVFVTRERSVDELSFYRTEEVKGGLDVFIGSKKVANTLGKRLKDKYNVEIKKSYMLYGKKDGKEVYRNVILVRF